MPFLYFYRNSCPLLHHDLTRLVRPNEPLVFGSERGNYVVEDEGIAPTQLEIAMEGEGYRLTDLSGEKTTVSDVRVESALLQDGDRIELGRFVLYYRKHEQEGFGDDDRSGRETLADAFARPTLPRALWLSAQPHGGAPLRVELDATARIGSGEDCDLTLAGDTVSTHHVELSREGGTLRLRDQESTNGTWLGAVRVHDIELSLGTRFRVGDWDVWVSGPDDSSANAGKAVVTPGGMVTADPVMLGLLRQVDSIAQSDCAVLIQGETGSGKELFAKAIHDRSLRAGQQLVAVNCGVGRSAENMATELFGYVKGAFTGADRAKAGVLASNEGGTVHVDEVGELPVALQPNLLRALAQGEIQPLGATRPSKVNVRFIFSTNRDLPQAIREGTFRDDLYYRLNVITFHLPPLRQRKGDILILWDHFMEEFTDCAPRQLTDAAREKLLAHPWPGNIRELWNAAKRVVLLGEPTPMIEASDIVFAPSAAPFSPAGATPAADGVVITTGKTWQGIKASALRAVMRSVQGNRSAAARQLDVERKTLILMLKAHGLERVGLEDGEVLTGSG